MYWLAKRNQISLVVEVTHHGHFFTSTVESQTVQIYTFAAHEKYMFYMNFTCDIKKIKLEVHS